MTDTVETETVTMEDIEDEEMEINNNNNDVPANNNNNTGMKNNNTYEPAGGESSRRRPVNIQVTAKVLFGSVSAISALNAERKKKPGSPQ
jgi:hypothetical protein